MTIKYLGHSCFEFKTDKGTILVDPFLAMSPNYIPENLTDIFVTHGHSDHLGNAIELSKKTGAQITAIFEVANYCSQNGASANGIGLGSWINYSWGRIIAVPAFHSSSLPNGNYGGNPCGFLFAINGTCIYHAGDTCLHREMKTIAELYRPDLALLPIGGHYTMDIEQAVQAANWLGVSSVIPMHYNTFDTIKVNIDDFKRQIREIGKRPIVMEIGKTID